MENRDIQIVGLVTLLVAAALTADTVMAAQGQLSAAAKASIAPASPHMATPRARPDDRIARLQESHAGRPEAGQTTERQELRLPRPRPHYFDLRIDMTDMLGDDALAGPAAIVEARRPSDDDLRD